MSTRNMFQIFLTEHSVLRDQFHELLYDLVPLLTKRLDSSTFAGGFLHLFTAKQLKNGSILNLRPCPCNMILDELHPTYIRLINSNMVFAADKQSGQMYLPGALPQWCALHDVVAQTSHSLHAVLVGKLQALRLGNAMHDQSLFITPPRSS